MYSLQMYIMPNKTTGQDGKQISIISELYADPEIG